MPTRSEIASRIQVSAPSRLHFGLMSVSAGGKSSGGGAGVMIQQPQTVITVESASQFGVAGDGAPDAQSRLPEFVDHWLQWQSQFDAFPFHRTDELPCRIRIERRPPQHVGLGSGTQLALSVASALNCFFDRSVRHPLELARSVGRAKRSKVGSYGFVHGGFVVEQLEPNGTDVAESIPLPERWRIVLVRLVDHQGLAGDVESGAFENISDTPEDVRWQLASIVNEQMVPAAQSCDFESFSTSVYEFGRRSGELFQSVQGGVYNGPAITRLVEWLRQHGVTGVGQSSWGPCVFGWCADNATAERIAKKLKLESQDDIDVWITRVSNRGAEIAERRPGATGANGSPQS